MLEGWNFACPNILRKCAWRPNFSQFGWEMTKISSVQLDVRSPTWHSSDCSSCQSTIFVSITSLKGMYELSTHSWDMSPGVGRDSWREPRSTSSPLWQRWDEWWWSPPSSGRCGCRQSPPTWSETRSRSALVAGLRSRSHLQDWKGHRPEKKVGVRFSN